MNLEADLEPILSTDAPLFASLPAVTKNTVANDASAKTTGVLPDFCGFPVLVAPMVGISHVAFRAMVRRYVPQGLTPIVFTEMLSTRRLPSEKMDSTAELLCTAAEKSGEDYFVPQLLGNEERFMAPSIRKLESLNPWGFDINMGCPATHVLKHNWGVRLMGDPAYAAKVVRMARGCTSKPVSVKMRGGSDKICDPVYLDEFTSALESGGADWLTVHARAREQGHDGRADWELVGNIACKRSIPVIANGDIQTSRDALDVVGTYGANGVMLARIMTVRPWILWQMAEDLGIAARPAGREAERAPRSFTSESGVVDTTEESREYFNACLMLIDEIEIFFGGNQEGALKRFSFFVATGARWFKFGHSFWALTRRAKSISDLRDRVQCFRDQYEFPLSQRVT